jgi:hypothetical protein
VDANEGFRLASGGFRSVQGIRVGRADIFSRYAKLPARDIADIFRFVNGRCNFLSELTPLETRYAKKIADDNSLMAVIMAQAIGASSKSAPKGSAAIDPDQNPSCTSYH